MTLPTDYIDGDVLTAADVNAITTAVNSNTDLKVAVGTFNAKGDLLVGLTNDSVGVLSAGTNGYLLSASSGATSGLQWIPSGGKVLQIATDSVGGAQTTTSTSATDVPGLSISFTPISASSLIVVEMAGNGSAYVSSGPADRVAGFQTSAGGIVYVGQYLDPKETDTDAFYAPVVSRALVTNTSTSARTYTGQFFVVESGCTAQFQSSTLTVTEYTV